VKVEAEEKAEKKQEDEEVEDDYLVDKSEE